MIRNKVEEIIHLPKVSIKGIWRQLTEVGGRREESRIGEINSPGSGEKILLLSFSRVIKDSRKVDS